MGFAILGARWPRRTLLAAAVAVLTAACTVTPPVALAPRTLDLAPLPEMDRAIQTAIAEHRLPGAVLHVERGAGQVERAYGRLSYEADAPAVTPDTVFDAASLTKVLATAPSVLLLAEDGLLDLDAPLARYFPECANGGKEGITVRQLLTHSSGLQASLPATPAWHGDAAAHALACALPVTNPPGTQFRYSDVNYVLLGQLVHKLAGMPLDAFAQRRLYGPLGMRDTGFLPLQRMAAGAIAPTQKSPADPAAKALHDDLAAGQVLQGVVHDPTARRMGGVAGSAGVFTTARDVARYARMLLGGGVLDGVRVLRPDSVRLLTTVQSPAGIAALRGMGMDINSPYAVRPRGTLFPVGSYGHTGFTGCVLWIDPGSGTFYVFLSNRVYPDDKSNVLPLYTELGTLAARAGGVTAPAAAPAAP